MNKCGECKFLKPIDNPKRGICVKSRSGLLTRRKTDNACKRFGSGEYDEEVNLKTICNTIANTYQGSRWG